MSLPIIPGPNNQLITGSAAPQYGSTANYAQGTQGSKTITTGASFPAAIVSGSITTYGNPVLIMCSGDANPTSAGYGRIQIYRNTTALCQALQYESSDSNENNPFSIQCVDPVEAGTYTYYLKANTVSQNTQFGEVSGPNLILIELSRV
jgi:hypothetical protein